MFLLIPLTRPYVRLNACVYLPCLLGSCFCFRVRPHFAPIFMVRHYGYDSLHRGTYIRTYAHATMKTLATDSLSLSKSEITILRVTAKRSRLVIDGEMCYDNVKVPFNYRTSIGVKGKVKTSKAPVTSVRSSEHFTHDCV